jgi:mRNA interferase RelE/StbE
VIGESKLGDLHGIQVHKFKFQIHSFLIAYRVAGPEIIFYSMGTHENFYRDLKRYLKEIENSDYS